MSALLTLDRMTVRRGLCPVVDAVSLTLRAGEFVGLIGPNGAGKTTLMRAALGLLPHEGVSSLTALADAERARMAAWLPQAREITWPVSVATLVELGRLPHLPPGGRLRAEDRAAVEAALEHMGLAGFRDRDATALSGGEQARVLIARALAQETPLLMADEPIAGLDPAAQITTMEVFGGLAGEGRAVLSSIHDLGLAARHCTRLVLMDGGRIEADGPPEAVLTEENLARVFHVRGYFARTAAGPVFQPLETIR
ncbi:ABC transporter [Maritimibacter sp. 55A14]|uniref:ABC transporter ATP-binding protein n=1 Tax=Maritimibacter sp. 55A14 TaxID=2174844 RepID=UPI000D61529B|nr:ABC transporter ATP-binding protein [Maritimibacter sp. 55A14]PWE33261.1 ABC transporter [Maritimibacter sp. 55A14]